MTGGGRVRKEQLSGKYTHIVRILIYYYRLMTQFCFCQTIYAEMEKKSTCASGRMDSRNGRKGSVIQPNSDSQPKDGM